MGFIFDDAIYFLLRLLAVVYICFQMRPHVCDIMSNDVISGIQHKLNFLGH